MLKYFGQVRGIVVQFLCQFLSGKMFILMQAAAPFWAVSHIIDQAPVGYKHAQFLVAIVPQ
jgi:hypothetical protein